MLGIAPEHNAQLLKLDQCSGVYTETSQNLNWSSPQTVNGLRDYWEVKFIDNNGKI